MYFGFHSVQTLTRTGIMAQQLNTVQHKHPLYVYVYVYCFVISIRLNQKTFSSLLYKSNRSGKFVRSDEVEQAKVWN